MLRSLALLALFASNCAIAQSNNLHFTSSSQQNLAFIRTPLTHNVNAQASPNIDQLLDELELLTNAKNDHDDDESEAQAQSDSFDEFDAVPTKSATLLRKTTAVPVATRARNNAAHASSNAQDTDALPDQQELADATRKDAELLQGDEAEEELTAQDYADKAASASDAAFDDSKPSTNAQDDDEDSDAELRDSGETNEEEEENESLTAARANQLGDVTPSSIAQGTSGYVAPNNNAAGVDLTTTPVQPVAVVAVDPDSTSTPSSDVTVTDDDSTDKPKKKHRHPWLHPFSYLHQMHKHHKAKKEARKLAKLNGGGGVEVNGDSSLQSTTSSSSPSSGEDTKLKPHPYDIDANAPHQGFLKRFFNHFKSKPQLSSDEPHTLLSPDAMQKRNERNAGSQVQNLQAQATAGTVGAASASNLQDAVREQQRQLRAAKQAQQRKDEAAKQQQQQQQQQSQQSPQDEQQQQNPDDESSAPPQDDQQQQQQQDDQSQQDQQQQPQQQQPAAAAAPVDHSKIKQSQIIPFEDNEDQQPNDAASQQQQQPAAAAAPAPVAVAPVAAVVPVAAVKVPVARDSTRDIAPLTQQQIAAKSGNVPNDTDDVITPIGGGGQQGAGVNALASESSVIGQKLHTVAPLEPPMPKTRAAIEAFSFPRPNDIAKTNVNSGSLPLPLKTQESLNQITILKSPVTLNVAAKQVAMLLQYQQTRDHTLLCQLFDGIHGHQQHSFINAAQAITVHDDAAVVSLTIPLERSLAQERYEIRCYFVDPELYNDDPNLALVRADSVQFLNIMTSVDQPTVTQSFITVGGSDRAITPLEVNKSNASHRGTILTLASLIVPALAAFVLLG